MQDVVTLAKLKRFSWTPFALVVLCFILPFVQVSCRGQKLASLSGVQLATGTEIQEPTMFGKPRAREVSGEPAVFLTLLLSIAAAGVVFFRSRFSSLLAAIAGALGFLLMMYVKVRLDNQVLSQGNGMLTVEYLLGFSAVCLLLLVGAGFNGFLYWREKQGRSSG